MVTVKEGFPRNLIEKHKSLWGPGRTAESHYYRLTANVPGKIKKFTVCFIYNEKDGVVIDDSTKIEYDGLVLPQVVTEELLLSEGIVKFKEI